MKANNRATIKEVRTLLSVFKKVINDERANTPYIITEDWLNKSIERLKSIKSNFNLYETVYKKSSIFAHNKFAKTILEILLDCWHQSPEDLILDLKELFYKELGKIYH